VPATARRLQLPDAEEVSAGTEAEGAGRAGRPQWLVVWATWCKPCAEEWPRIARGRGLLRQRGIDVRLTLLSIDTEAGALDAYLRAHPALAATGGRVLRSRSPDGFDAWARHYALGAAGAGLPFHIFATAGGALSCVHAGPLSDRDVALIPDLVK
jgi:hypothetical protein